MKKGAEEFVERKPRDEKETILHIAAKRGDLELVKWLVDHSEYFRASLLDKGLLMLKLDAEPEDCNTAGLTALHVALEARQTPVVQYFFKTLPPSESDNRGIYTLSSQSSQTSESILRLALRSAVPELAWLVLENKLVSSPQISEDYAWLSSPSGEKQLKHACNSRSTAVHADELIEELEDLLIAYGAVKTSTHKHVKDTDGAGDRRAVDSSTTGERRSEACSNNKPSRLTSVNPQIGLPTPTSTASVDSTSARGSPSPLDDAANARSSAIRGDQKQSWRGRGRGRSRGRARGRGVK